MRLKSIKLSGFKSFVDPTTVQFPSALCAVVGPNGCGKSNVIDAVRWVMGESSAKNLRGEQMTDVIFNGSGTRKPVGQASVELLFDNDDHRLKGEYANFTEVSLKRKVERDGQSSYFLNGTKCRRKDITDIFLGTGLGPRSYSIIEQGMISRLIESKPEELRIFIEEAAGISKYKERRKETESRIKRTRDNLERLADIRDELQKQLSHLQRQSVAAEKYGELKHQERQFQANLAALRWQMIDSQLRKQKEMVRELELKIEQSVAEQRSIDAKVEKHLVANTELTDQFGEVQARFYGLGNDIARLEQSIEHHLERTNQLIQDLRETEEAWEQTKEEMDVDLQRVIKLGEELSGVEPQLEQARKSVDISSAALEEAESAMQDWQKAWDSFSLRAEEPRQTAEVEQSRIQQLDAIVERGLERKSRLQEELAGLQGDASGDAGAEHLINEISLLEARIVDLQESNRGLIGKIETLRRQDDRNNGELDEKRSELQASKGKLASLEALQQAALGHDDFQVNEWLGAHGLDQRQRLGEAVSVSEGWEAALEVVLGDALQSICIDDSHNLSELLSSLPDSHVTLLDISWAENSRASERANWESLACKITADWSLDGLLDGVYCCNSMAEALSLRNQLDSHESFVCPDGVWIARQWIKFRGSANPTANVLQRKTKIENIINIIKNLESNIDKLIEDQSEIRAEISSSEAKRESEQEEISEVSTQLSDLKSELSARLAKDEQNQLRRNRVSKDLEELIRQLAQEEDNTASARARLQIALDTMEEDSKQRQEFEQNRDALRLELNRARQESIQDKEKAHQLELSYQGITAQLRSTRESMDRMASQVTRATERMESLKSQINSSDQPLQTMRGDLETLLNSRLGVEKEMGEAKSRLDENEYAIRSLEKERSEIESRTGDIRENLMQTRIASEGASVRQQSLLDQLRDTKFELESVLAGLDSERDEASYEQELEKISNRIQRLGPINLAAVDEYKQQSERKVYLDQQNEDLTKALATLQNAIRKIDKETRARFKDTFDRVNDGLQALFPRVFGGGHAYLDMTGDDLLDTGVAIMARPPGKRNSTIHLLSGGEKAMTAIALVFSIFQLNPSPFCMLDEVDAPLDDANVGRYANLVKEMSNNVQFIFITHNKLTMEMANQLLGVTMHEPGVSRIVSVDIDEAAELAAM